MVCLVMFFMCSVAKKPWTIAKRLPCIFVLLPFSPLAAASLWLVTDPLASVCVGL